MEIHITDDFDLDRIADSGQCFRWKKDDSDDFHAMNIVFRVCNSGAELKSVIFN